MSRTFRSRAEWKRARWNGAEQERAEWNTPGGIEPLRVEQSGYRAELNTAEWSRAYRSMVEKGGAELKGQTDLIRPELFSTEPGSGL